MIFYSQNKVQKVGLREQENLLKTTNPMKMMNYQTAKSEQI